MLDLYKDDIKGNIFIPKEFSKLFWKVKTSSHWSRRNREIDYCKEFKKYYG